MKLKITLALILITKINLAQYSTSTTVFAKTFSKEESLYKSKSYVMTEIIGVSDNLEKFEIDPLAAANSGELTSLVYECQAKGIEGLLFAFYGDYWNKSGVVYQGYGFKKFDKATALTMLSKVDKIINENLDYLKSDYDNNNIYFKFDDITYLIYYNKNMYMKLRVFWDSFDSEWDYSAFLKTKKRLEKKLKNK